jgi:hypothetical protein
MFEARKILFPLGLCLVAGALLTPPPAAVAMPPSCEDGGYCPGQGFCGDGICNASSGEDCDFCPSDCGGCSLAVCGDGICQAGESCSSCSGDCGSCPVSTNDGHPTCDGWDRQGVCALSFPIVASGVEFRRLRGGGGYAWQTFLTWNSAEFNGFGRFTVADGTVGIISTSPLSGQVPLYRWSARKGFVYSTNPNLSASDYVYGGVAGYVWPAGSNQGYPLYRFYSDEYGFFYTSFPGEISCQPAVRWQYDGEIARLNWSAPFTQASRTCYNNQYLGLPGPCDPFAVTRCQERGSDYNSGNCTCFDGLP